MKFNRLIIFIGFMFYLFTLKSAPVYHPIDRSSWEKTVDGLSYTEEKPEPVEMDMRAPFQISSDFLRVIGFIVIAALLIFLLLKLLGKGLFSNTKVAKQKSIIKQLEDDPMESDLDRFLREAMENHDYRLAIRIYYIMLLKALHEKNFIIWKKDKQIWIIYLKCAGIIHIHNWKPILIYMNLYGMGNGRLLNRNSQLLAVPLFL